MRYGYARVSTVDQSTALQEEALQRAGCTIIRAEQVSGTSRQGRRELETLLEFLRAGDTLCVTRIDRLARSIGDLQDIVRLVRGRGATIHATEQAIDTGTAAGKAFLDMLGVFAEFETNLRSERQMEGVRRAQAAGKYRGRVSKLDPDALQSALERAGGSPAGAARHLGVSRSTIYRNMRGE